MKITYINHSCFSVELDNCILLFDYFEGSIPKFDNNKKIYVFSSHSHHDHYNKSIFDLRKIYSDVTYILSDDIKVNKSNDVIFVKPDENIYVDSLEIKTLKSTDIGVAFIINVEGKSIYHAGDLNWWHWEGENTVEDNKHAEFIFKEEMNKIKGNAFDIAFIPLDSRQGNEFYLGFDTFMRNTNTKIAIPMHCWGDYSVINKLKQLECSNAYKDKVVDINKKNQEIYID